MKKLLILGSSLGTLEIVKYAQSRSVYVIVTDYLPVEASKPKQVADEYWMINTAEVDILEQMCRENEISAVFCGVSEFNIERTIELCTRLGFPFYADAKAWEFSRNKRLFKELCKKLDAPVATDYYIKDISNEKQLESVKYPVVVKPVDLSGNLGVSYCHNKEELIDAYIRAKSLSDNPEIIVERMLKGEEWHGYYAIANGKISLVALNAMYSQPGMPKNCYSITTTATNHVKQYVDKVSPLIEKVLLEAGCKEGIAWVQVMLDQDGEFYIIEMGYRLTGECIFIPYRQLCEFDSIKWLVDYALGEPYCESELPIPQKQAYTKCACAYMLWTNRAAEVDKVIGMEEIESIPEVHVELLAYPGKQVDAYRPVGTILFTTSDCEQMCKLIDKINKTVKILDDNNCEIITKYTEFDFLKKVYAEGKNGK